MSDGQIRDLITAKAKDAEKATPGSGRRAHPPRRSAGASSGHAPVGGRARACDDAVKSAPARGGHRREVRS
jgi:hypothetical protein